MPAESGGALPTAACPLAVVSLRFANSSPSANMISGGRVTTRRGRPIIGSICDASQKHGHLPHLRFIIFDALTKLRRDAMCNSCVLGEPVRQGVGSAVNLSDGRTIRLEDHPHLAGSTVGGHPDNTARVLGGVEMSIQQTVDASEAGLGGGGGRLSLAKGTHRSKAIRDKGVRGNRMERSLV
jgi:hypothetical protein